MRVAVVGASGQLGTDLCRVYARRGHTVVALDHQDVDLCDGAACRSRLAAAGPELIVNAAAVHHVETCEREPARAFAVNSLGVRHLALLSAEWGCRLAQVSTDYVFDGAQRTPYRESDRPAPLNVYGNSKLSGELFVQAICPRHFIVRVSGLFGCAPCRGKGGRNFVQLMLSLARERGEVCVVDDESLSPTWTEEVARQLEVLTSTENFGLFHVASQGGCSWFQFAEEIFRLTGVPVRLRRAHRGDFPGKAPRPAYSVLENSRLKQLGLDRMPTWRLSLKRYLEAAHGPLSAGDAPDVLVASLPAEAQAGAAP